MRRPAALIPFRSPRISTRNLSEPVTVQFDKPLDSTSPQSDDDEAKMRRNLGLDTASGPGSGSSLPSDPLRSARQAIRSQAAAREYVERQLAQAQTSVHDLRTKLFHARQEKDRAVEAARSATARKVTADRIVAATEAALTTEKTARDRADRALRDAQATIRDLQARLEAADQRFESAKAEIAAERQSRQTADIALWAPKTAREPAAAPASRDEVISTLRRPVGRTTVTARSVQQSTTPIKNFRASGKTGNTKAGKPRGTGRTRSADEQKPIEWWVEGWRRRGR